MHHSKPHDEFASGVSAYPPRVRSFLETSARYFGLAGLPRDLQPRHTAAESAPTGVSAAVFNQNRLDEEAAA